MFVVIFEVHPKTEEWETYLDLAKMLRPELEQIDGFIDNERFACQTHAGDLLSLSTWRDEKALIRWRTVAAHHEAQEQGRSRILADYHLRVGEITVDSGVQEGEPVRQERFDATAVGKAQVVTIREASNTLDTPVLPALDTTSGLVSYTHYQSITTRGKNLWLTAWRDQQALTAWDTHRHHAPASRDATVRFRAVRVIRDYSMHDRREAPQYYLPVKPNISTASGDCKGRDE